MTPLVQVHPKYPIRYRHNLSTGLNSGEYGGRCIIFIFSGIFSPLCHPALFMTKIICLVNFFANSFRKTCLYSFFIISVSWYCAINIFESQLIRNSSSCAFFKPCTTYFRMCTIPRLIKKTDFQPSFVDCFL